MSSIALTDKGNMFGIMEFYFEAKERGIHPVLGTEIYVCKPKPSFSLSLSSPLALDDSEVSQLVLLAQNKEGYHNLCQIQSISHEKEYDPLRNFPWVDEKTLLQHSAGLFALSGSLKGGIASTLLEKGKDAAFSRFKRLKSIYGQNLCLEIQRPYGVKDWDKVNIFLMELSQENKVPLIAANELFLIRKEQRLLQKILRCVENNITLGELDEKELSPEDAYFKSGEQMLRLFQDIPEACEQTLRISEACQVDFTLDDKEGKKNIIFPRCLLKMGNLRKIV